MQADISTGKVKDSVILTVFDRDSVTLAATFRGLLKNNMEDTEIVFVDDNSSSENAKVYGDLISHVRGVGIPVVLVQPGEYEAYRVDGSNNPARAYNLGLENASGERVFWLSSDCILQPHALDRARRFDLDRVVYTCHVIDMDTGKVMSGPSGVNPMMWFLGTSRMASLECGGFDEEYLKGFHFHDNDFVGRLACHTGRMVFDWDSVIFHQSHGEVSDDLTGYRTNAEYTKKKWRGVPFVSARPALKIIKGVHELGCPEWTVSKMDAAAPVSG